VQEHGLMGYSFTRVRCVMRTCTRAVWEMEDRSGGRRVEGNATATSETLNQMELRLALYYTSDTFTCVTCARTSTTNPRDPAICGVHATSLIIVVPTRITYCNNNIQSHDMTRCAFTNKNKRSGARTSNEYVFADD
jgi:hypothetical protein